MLKLCRGLCLLVPLISTSACSLQQLQHAGYYAGQNYRSYQCQQAMQNDCATRQNYDSYQQQRAEIMPH